jgi:hypothetical protein
MVEVISLPKTCHRHVFASQRHRIVALAVKIGNANMKPPPEMVEVISLPKTCPGHVRLSKKSKIIL